MISLMLATLLQMAPPTTPPVAPGAFDVGRCLGALEGRAEAKGYSDDHLQAMMSYYYATKEFSLNEASARFASFARLAKLTDAQADSLTAQIESEPGYKALFANQMAIADKLEEAVGKIDNGSPAERCGAVSDFSRHGLAAAENAKAQFKYVDDWTSKKAREMGIALAR